jgi:hypothetical protein
LQIIILRRPFYFLTGNPALYVLKCDIKEFFASVDHEILIKILKRYIKDIKIVNLLNKIIFSFYTTHENKVYIKTHASGVDFLGWIHFPKHRQIRTSTKRKTIKKLKGYPERQTIISYRGLLQHGSTYKLKQKIGTF